MLKSIFLTAFATVAIALTPGAALVVVADEPAPSPDASFRPPSGVLRHVDARTASAAPAHFVAPAKPELVIFVGGYQTCVCDLPLHDKGFGDYADVASAAGYDVKYFGQDDRFPYDSYGHIAESGRSLRDEIRSLAGRYSAIHIVAHSMGGVVVDQAFAQGLSRADGVATYVALSSPHSGSDAARAATEVNETGPRELVRRIASLFHMESVSDAVTDLASARPIPPPDGVVRLDLRESTDALVTAFDASDPGVTSRVLNDAAEGHGVILKDRDAIDLTMRTIATRRVPPDDRSRLLATATDRSSELVALLISGLLLCTAFVLCLVYRSPVIRFAMNVQALALPPARRP